MSMLPSPRGQTQSRGSPWGRRVPLGQEGAKEEAGGAGSQSLGRSRRNVLGFCRKGPKGKTLCPTPTARRTRGEGMEPPPGAVSVRSLRKPTRV